MPKLDAKATANSLSPLHVKAILMVVPKFGTPREKMMAAGLTQEVLDDLLSAGLVGSSRIDSRLSINGYRVFRILAAAAKKS
jgi:hypothetical protein